MKKYITIVITLIIGCMLAGCSVINASKEIKSIVDTAAEEGACFMCAEEAFYEDDNYVYTFAEDPMSLYIIVEYTNGSKQNVKEALEEGNIVISDLDTYGIRYDAVPKHIGWIGETFENGPREVINEPEEIYRDDKYIYYLPTTRSDFINVYYKDESEQDMKSALSEGKIRITDLASYDVDYYKIPINKVVKCDDWSDWDRAKRELIEGNALKMGKDKYENFTDNFVIVLSEQEITFDTSDVVAAVFYKDDSNEDIIYEYYIQYETVEAAEEAAKELEKMESVIAACRDSDQAGFLM